MLCSEEPIMKKHFVIFFSPGSFVSEQTEKPIESWDVEKAVELLKEIKERYGATPYGFCFTTRGRNSDDLDSKEISRSGMYYLGGKVLTLQDVKARNNPDDRTLIFNMECNKYERVIENTNSWKVTLPLNDNDTVLEYDSAV